LPSEYCAALCSRGRSGDTTALHTVHTVQTWMSGDAAPLAFSIAAP
jgi:hypothetical protein